VDTFGFLRRLYESPRIPHVFRIQPRPTEQLNVKVQPEVIAEIDRMAVRLATTRSAVARALLDSGLDQLRCFEQGEGQ
jgi:hypothetical protein